MAALLVEYKKELRKMLEEYALINTILQRRIFLEDAGLLPLESQIGNNTNKQEFCYEVVTLCEKAGSNPIFREDAVILLLRFVREEVVVGHIDKVNLIDNILSTYQSTSFNSTFESVTHTPLTSIYLTPDNLWNELLIVDGDRDWSAVIFLGEKLRRMGYRVRDTRNKLASAYMARGRSYHNIYEYDKAILDKSLAIDLYLDNAEYYYSRGVSYHNAACYEHPIGDFAKAIVDKSRAIALDPTKAKYYESRSNSYHEAANRKHPIGDYIKALEDCFRSIEIEPMNGKLYHARGLTYQAMNNLAAAQSDFDKAIELGY